MRKELLRISHVSLERDGEQLLDNLEFQMFAGEIFGLVARNPLIDHIVCAYPKKLYICPLENQTEYG